MSPAIAKIFAEHSEAYDFMDTVCRDIVSPESREAVVGLVDISSLRERMEGVPYLAAEVRDCRGAWYSLQVVPSIAMSKAGWSRSSWRRTTYRWSSMPRSCHIKTN